MEETTLGALIRANDASALRQAFIKEHNTRYDPIDFLNYNPATHSIVTDRIHRRDKVVYYDIPGEVNTATGAPAKGMKIVPVTRLAVAWQKEIVDTAVSFSVGGKITLKANPKTDIEKKLLTAQNYNWQKNKMRFRVKDIARKLFSETEVACIVYALKDKDEDSGVSVRTKIVSPGNGYTLYPIYNSLDVMIAFGVEYLTSEYKFCLDVYTKDTLFRYSDVNGFELQKTVSYDYGKIPVAYFNQDESEWKRVQHAIEEYERVLSDLIDTNAYNGAPILFAEGDIEGFSDKGEQGKVLKGTNGAKVSYLSWNHAPETTKLVLSNLEKEIRNKTRTVDLSPEAIKGMGSAPSGVAFDRILIGPHMKGQDHRDGGLGEGLQRLVNIFQSTIVNIIDETLKPARNLFVEPDIDLFRIDDTDERITTMAKAMPGVVFLSKETAIKYVGLNLDTNSEMDIILKEQKELAEMDSPATGGNPGGGGSPKKVE